MIAGILLCVCTLRLGSAAADPFSPATFRDGQLPPMPFNSAGVGGGQVLVEATIDSGGAVTGVRPLRATPSFTERVAGAIRTWRFAPARERVDAASKQPGGPEERPVESRVLIAAIFRPPSLIGPTLGEAIRDVGTASTDVPYPISMVTPPHPPRAAGSGIVLIEAEIGSDGALTKAVMRRSTPPFDEAALGAVRKWTFRPAQRGRSAVPAVMYIVIGFPVPITSASPVAPGQ